MCIPGVPGSSAQNHLPPGQQLGGGITGQASVVSHTFHPMLKVAQLTDKHCCAARKSRNAYVTHSSGITASMSESVSWAHQHCRARRDWGSWDPPTHCPARRRRSMCCCAGRRIGSLSMRPRWLFVEPAGRQCSSRGCTLGKRRKGQCILMWPERIYTCDGGGGQRGKHVVIPW